MCLAILLKCTAIVYHKLVGVLGKLFVDAGPGRLEPSVIFKQ